MPDNPASPRARARVETLDQIKAVAREHLATDGPALSLRAVARDLGVVSSAVYRYYASRDELVAALTVDGYTALADAVEQAETAVSRRDLTGRWAAVGRAVRAWAAERPAEYALLYGSGFGVAQGVPAEAAEQADRPLLVILDILGDAVERGRVEVPADRLPREVRTDLDGLRQWAGYDRVPPALLGRALSVWAQLHGTVGFELSGRYVGVLTDLDAWAEHQWRMAARYVGLR